MRYPWHAAILIIGNEILVGRVLDTNSQKIAKTLTTLGYEVVEIRKVRDNIDEIAKALKELLGKAFVIITTGGLGPTYDDVTLEGIAKALGLPLHLSQEALEMIKEKLEKMDLKMTKERMKMAIVPKGSQLIPNPVGVAPGVAIVTKEYMVFALPGVPKEMEEMLLGYVINYLERESFVRKAEACEELRGVREADIAPIIERFAKEYTDAYIKTHPRMEGDKPVVKVCVLASSYTVDDAKCKATAILKRILNEVRRG